MIQDSDLKAAMSMMPLGFCARAHHGLVISTLFNNCHTFAWKGDNHDSHNCF